MKLTELLALKELADVAESIRSWANRDDVNTESLYHWDTYEYAGSDERYHVIELGDKIDPIWLVVPKVTNDLDDKVFFCRRLGWFDDLKCTVLEYDFVLFWDWVEWKNGKTPYHKVLTRVGRPDELHEYLVDQNHDRLAEIIDRATCEYWYVGPLTRNFVRQARKLLRAYRETQIDKLLKSIAEEQDDLLNDAVPTIGRWLKSNKGRFFGKSLVFMGSDYPDDAPLSHVVAVGDDYLIVSRQSEYSKRHRVTFCNTIGAFDGAEIARKDNGDLVLVTFHRAYGGFQEVLTPEVVTSDPTHPLHDEYAAYLAEQKQPV